MRTEAEIGGLTIHGERLVKVAPSDGASLDAKEFLHLLGIVEAVL